MSMNEDQAHAPGGNERRKGRGIHRRALLAGTAGVAAAGVLGGAGSAFGATTASPNATGKPRYGGNFRLGVAGGGPSDLFDGQNFVSQIDETRLVTLFEPLMIFDDNYRLQNWLAEEVSSTDPSVWTIRVRKGIEFSNGKTLQAEDVAYSLRRIADKKNGLAGYSMLTSVDPKQIEIMDPYTVRLRLTSPNSELDQALGQYYNTIVPVGYEKYPAPQAGTGAFTLKSFTPGTQSVSLRNPNYWHHGEPYFDQVTILDYPNDTARVNALLGGEIDAMTSLPTADIPTVQAHHGLSVLVDHTAEWLPLCMRVDVPPFDKVEVRQAMRLLVDRPAMIEQVLSGYGSLGNDIFSQFDSAYDHSLPQRHQDLAQAKFLLKKAGVENFSTTLNTTPGEAGMVPMASVFANQARAAGVKIEVRNWPNFYGSQYLKLAFSCDFWGTRNYLPQISMCLLSTSPFNETHWPPKDAIGAKYLDLYHQALAASDPALRKELIQELQKIDYEYGGYIIPFFTDLIGAYSSRVQGFTASKGTLPLGYLGHGYATIWFA